MLDGRVIAYMLLGGVGRRGMPCGEKMADSQDDFKVSIATASGKITCTSSCFSLENLRFSSDERHSCMHPNEDRVNITSVVADENEGRQSVLFSVLDGHDGSRAVEYFQSHLPQCLKERLSTGAASQDIVKIVEDAFLQTDQQFFGDLQQQISRKKEITRLLEGYNSYEAYLQYPCEVAELQRLDQEMSGGTTMAVVGVEMDKDGCRVWSANVGNTRVVLCESAEKCEQLSVDHDATNEEELERLSKLGLDEAKIRTDGRLGGYENVRCLGDYALKEGYCDVDDISGSREPPGIANPHVSGPRPLNLTDGKPQYLFLMSDGIYQLLEAAAAEDKGGSKQEVTDYVHKDILRRIIAVQDSTDAVGSGSGAKVAKRVVTDLAEYVVKMYIDNCRQEDSKAQRMAQLFRKQDDMTLMVIKFMFHSSVDE